MQTLGGEKTIKEGTTANTAYVTTLIETPNMPAMYASLQSRV